MKSSDRNVITAAVGRVRAYLDELDRIDAARHQYADAVHGINERDLNRSDLRSLLNLLDAARNELGMLQADLEHHKGWEGEAVDFRNRRGSWEDVSDRIDPLVERLNG